MINIISRALISSFSRGPRKVVENLIKGLEETQYPYVINQALDSTELLWIHDDTVALQHLSRLPSKIKVIVGPNLYVAPQWVPIEFRKLPIVWLQPSDWAKDFWDQHEDAPARTVVWAAGIDTERFKPMSTPKEHLLVYVKQRAESDVLRVTDFLKKRDCPFHVIRYGEYTDHEYRTLLAGAKGIIWLGRAESQGIGLLEALSMNVPILVCDTLQFGDWDGYGKEFFTPKQLTYASATAAPYFSDGCGMKVAGLATIETDIAQFLATLNVFKPRSFITEHLTCAHQAEEFVNLYRNEYDVSDTTLQSNKRFNSRRWRNTGWWFLWYIAIKDKLRPLYLQLLKRKT